jgi:hypothetical protein
LSRHKRAQHVRSNSLTGFQFDGAEVRYSGPSGYKFRVKITGQFTDQSVPNHNIFSRGEIIKVNTPASRVDTHDIGARLSMMRGIEELQLVGKSTVIIKLWPESDPVPTIHGLVREMLQLSRHLSTNP